MRKSILFLTVCVLQCVSCFAQGDKEKMTREDKQEKNDARTARINMKNDYILFHRQALGLPEYLDEKKKATALQASGKLPVKLVITIDSLDEGDTATKKMTGYIVQNVGDNATILYDLAYDRATKKIVSVSKTQDAIDAEKADKEEKEEKAEETRDGKPSLHKKNKDDDDDDDPDDKPSKTKEKDDE